MRMKVTTEDTSEVVSGKEYPLLIQRRSGPQELEVGGERGQADAFAVFEGPLGGAECAVGGERVQADAFAVFEGPLGRAVVWWRVCQGPVAEEERLAKRAKLQAAARAAMEELELK